jgi:hypothetical protein
MHTSNGKERVATWKIVILSAFTVAVLAACIVAAIYGYGIYDYYFNPLEPHEYATQCWPVVLPTDLPKGMEPTPEVSMSDSRSLWVKYTCLIDGERHRFGIDMEGLCDDYSVLFGADEEYSISWSVAHSDLIQGEVYDTKCFVSVEGEQSSASYTIYSPYNITDTVRIIESMETVSP